MKFDQNLLFTEIDDDSRVALQTTWHIMPPQLARMQDGQPNRLTRAGPDDHGITTSQPPATPMLQLQVWSPDQDKGLSEMEGWDIGFIASLCS